MGNGWETPAKPRSARASQLRGARGGTGAGCGCTASPRALQMALDQAAAAAAAPPVPVRSPGVLTVPTSLLTFCARSPRLLLPSSLISSLLR